MKLACSVEIGRHGVDLKARVALKVDRSVFKARSKKQDAKKRLSYRNCFSTKKKKYEARSKVPKTNACDDWTLTIT